MESLNISWTGAFWQPEGVQPSMAKPFIATKCGQDFTLIGLAGGSQSGFDIDRGISELVLNCIAAHICQTEELLQTNMVYAFVAARNELAAKYPVMHPVNYVEYSVAYC